jgi:hypothetical protein
VPLFASFSAPRFNRPVSTSRPVPPVKLRARRRR